MAYMVYQQLTTAVRDGYRGAERGVVEHQLAEARKARRWLEALDIDPAQRASLVEQVAVIEEALAEVERTSP